MQSRLPFELSKTESFYEKLNEWIGDVFYDILPEKGFELRDEQIFMAFQLEKAFKDKQITLAEAGVGTGKTIVYLLYAICYARYTGKPAIIACADETLIEQLVKKEGDIKKLEQALDLNVDVRLAKSRDQYLCIKKLDTAMQKIDDEAIDELYDTLPDFVHDHGSMVKFHHYGDRKDYPHLADEQWNHVNWDTLQDCFTCDKRHRCGQTLYRDYYRNAQDLIICSHDFYMEHIWTKDARKREGQLPLLPDSSSVVFDEGHLLEYACQKALTYKITEVTLETLLTRILSNDIRDKTLYLIEKAITQNEKFFRQLEKAALFNIDAERQEIERTNEVLSEARSLSYLISQIEEELVFESELFVIDEYDLKIVEEYLEQIGQSLSLFIQNSKGITWFEEHNFEKTLVIMPRLVEDIMRDEVFSQKKPFVFSSATLSDHQSFDYLTKSLGIDKYTSFSVESPFDYDEKMNVYLSKQPNFEDKVAYTLEKVEQSEGKALLLFSSKHELQQFKTAVEGKVNYPIYFEGDGEISELVSHFQNERDSILCSHHLWEGLDIPGESLTNVMIFSLPFPPNDPVFKAKREGLSDPFNEVDMPYMLLRLRQGVGRLIRTSEDYGQVHILLDDNVASDTIEQVKAVLPTKVS